MNTVFRLAFWQSIQHQDPKYFFEDKNKRNCYTPHLETYHMSQEFRFSHLEWFERLYLDSQSKFKFLPPCLKASQKLRRKNRNQWNSFGNQNKHFYIRYLVITKLNIWACLSLQLICFAFIKLRCACYLLSFVHLYLKPQFLKWKIINSIVPWPLIC